MAPRVPKSYVQKIMADSGNWPMIAVNVAATALVCFHLGRKLFTHPDVLISPSERGYGEYTPTMAEHSDNFRSFNSGYVPFVEKVNFFFMKYLHGLEEANPITKITNSNKPIPPPLEYTSYFNDGLYENVQPTAAPSGFYNDTRNYREEE